MTLMLAKRFRGIGLVDLMVGLAIGLIAMLIIIKVAVLFESRRRSSAGIADAQLNAASATLIIARELRIAGQGLGPADALGCGIVHDLSTLGALSLQPVQIIDGANGGPDRLRILASAIPQIISSASLIAAHAASDSAMMLDITLGIAPEHRLLLYEPGKSCALFKATSVPLGGYRVVHQLSSASGLPDHMAGARVINLGSLHHLEFSIDANGYLQVNRYLSDANVWQSSALASGVVSLQAQYGFDTQSGARSSTKVTRWSDTMLDADGNGTTGDNSDLRRLIAVRVALVVRSAERSDQGCKASAPQWMAGSASSGKLALTDISLNHVNDWRCYRYRILQTEVPLRNLLWTDS
jgi:type IV pilus assembly protein PilW